MRLLIGFDGSDGGRDALELARVLGVATGARALVVAVLMSGPLPLSYALLDSEESAEAGPLFEEARERLAGIEVETRAFGGGTPAGLITTLGEEEDVDTIVVGSPHRGPVGRALLGSVAESLLSGASRAVVVAPRGYAQERHDSPRLIAVAYDGTLESKAALRRAEDLARPAQAKIRIVTVVAPPVALPGVIGYTPPEPPDPEKLMSDVISSIDPELTVDSRLLDGPPAIKLVEACAEGVDLIVAGSRGYGPLLRVLIGSVSSQLIRKSPCPVLVVPRPSRTQGDQAT